MKNEKLMKSIVDDLIRSVLDNKKMTICFLAGEEMKHEYNAKKGIYTIKAKKPSIIAVDSKKFKVIGENVRIRK